MASAENFKTGVLFVVGTPIGNLQDITLRALKVLGEVDLIACEDTRHTGQLLAAHGISRRLISYFDHNEKTRIPELIEMLRDGARIALVTDAGTPSISDPGYRLVRSCLEVRIRVVSVPGPSAAIAALSIAGLPTDRFTFEGFLPARSSARKTHLKSLAREGRTMVFFESARRLRETLTEMVECFGADRPAAVVREITKVFEECVSGALSELVERVNAEPPRGEITLLVGGDPKHGQEAASNHQATPTVTLDILLAAGLGLKQASAVMAKLEGRSRREFYQEGLQRGLQVKRRN